jgi:hypothetical protein
MTDFSLLLFVNSREKAGTGEAIMNMFMIDARRPPRIGSLAIMSGTMLCAMVVAGPAFSADLPYDYNTAYGPRYEYYRSHYYDRDYDRGCYRCSCCGGRRYAPVAERPIIDYYVPDRYAPERYVPERYVAVEERRPVERDPVAERHWVQRDYFERRYPGGAAERYSYPPSYRYSSYYPVPRGGDPYSRSAAAEPPRYTDFPPAPVTRDYPPARVTYDWDGPRPRYVEVPPSREFRPAYEYEPAPPRTAYDYETSPRPPATVPSGYYYYPGHAE